MKIYDTIFATIFELLQMLPPCSSDAILLIHNADAVATAPSSDEPLMRLKSEALHATSVLVHQARALFLWVVASAEQHALVALRLLVLADTAWLLSVSLVCSKCLVYP